MSHALKPRALMERYDLARATHDISGHRAATIDGRHAEGEFDVTMGVECNRGASKLLQQALA